MVIIRFRIEILTKRIKQAINTNKAIKILSSTKMSSRTIGIKFM